MEHFREFTPAQKYTRAGPRGNDACRHQCTDCGGLVLHFRGCGLAQRPKQMHLIVHISNTGVSPVGQVDIGQGRKKKRLRQDPGPQKTRHGCEQSV